MNDGLTVSQSQIDSNLHLDKHLAPAGLGRVGAGGAEMSTFVSENTQTEELYILFVEMML